MFVSSETWSKDFFFLGEGLLVFCSNIQLFFLSEGTPCFLYLFFQFVLFALINCFTNYNNSVFLNIY